MTKPRIRIGIVGCGAIGSGIARAVKENLKKECLLTGVYDIVPAISRGLAKKLSANNIVRETLNETIQHCDLMIEAVNAIHTTDIIRQALKAGRGVLAMSVGKLLNAPEIFRLAERKSSSLLLPSGAIAGLDALKAASLCGISKIILTTRKPLTGFTGNAYLIQKRIYLDKIKKETVLFEGTVDSAVLHFPQNINVAATLALASGAKEKITVRIVTSPAYTQNIHEVVVEGDFGRMVTRTENVVCPDNPKTSYLAVLSGIQTLKQYCSSIRVGT